MRMTNVACVAILGSIFIFVSTSFVPAGEIYTWTDKDGNLHITEHPPPKGAKLKEVTTYSGKTETPDSDKQAPPDNRVTDRKKLKAAGEAQRQADIAAKEAHEAGIKASDAVIKVHDAQDKRASQGREARDRVSRDDVKKAEGEAMRAQEESKEALEEAKKARDKAKKVKKKAQD